MFYNQQHAGQYRRQREWKLMRFNIKAFALTCGLFWGFSVFFLTWWIMLFYGQHANTGMLGHIYRGFSITPLGSIIGLVYALIDGFVGGLIFAWLYNLLANRFEKR
jgi:hypothetical protein